MFIDKEDFKMVIGDKTLEVVSQMSQENIDRAVAEAVEEVSGYLRPVYDTEALFAATGDGRNRTVVMYTADIALYHLSASQPQRMGIEVRKERYDRAVKWLEGVQSGRIIPDLPPADTATDGGGIGLSFHSNTPLRHNW